MRKDVFRKGMILGIIFLFVGAGVVPSISGNVGIVNKEPNERNTCTVNNDGLGVDNWHIVDTVGLWHFNEGVGDVALDISGYRNHGGIHNGAEWTTDTPPGGALYALRFYADANSYVGVNDDPSLDFDDLGENEGFMIDFWMKNLSTTFKQTYVGLVSKYHDGGYLVSFGNSGKVGFNIRSPDAQSGKSIQSNTAISDKLWHHIVAVWSGDTLYIYVDDMTTPDNSLYVGDFTIGDASKWLEIGNDWATDNLNPFDGMIDEVQISIISDDGIPPETHFTRPEYGHIYLSKGKIDLGPFPNLQERKIVIIIGGIDVNVFAKDNESGMNATKFYVNDNFMGKGVLVRPNIYEWKWYQWRIGPCVLKVEACDKAGNCGVKEMIIPYYFDIEF